MTKKDNSDVPPTTLALLRDIEQERRAELDALDSRFQDAFAEGDYATNLRRLSPYITQRFDLVADYLSQLAAAPDATYLDSTLPKALETAKTKALKFASVALKNVPKERRDDLKSQLDLKLNSRKLHWHSVARTLHRQTNPPPSVEELLPDNEGTNPQVTSAVIARRRALIKQFRLDHEDMTVPDFARHVGMSETAIRGIVKEDRRRYSVARRDKLLEKLCLTKDQWYAKQ